MTPQRPNWPTNGADSLLPPPGCPAHREAVRLSSDAMQLSDPRELYAQMRDQHGSVVPIRLDGEVPAWLVVGYEELLEVARTEALFSRDSRHWREWAEGRVPHGWPLMPQVAYRDNALFAQGPRHARLRGALSAGLRLADSADVRRFVQECADGLIDEILESGRADLVTQYAAPLPLLVLTRLFGLSQAAGQSLLTAIPRLLEGGEGAQQADREISRLLDQQVAARRVRREDDFISWLIHDPAIDVPLTDEEVREQAWLTILSGAGASTHWIANTLEALLRDSRIRVGLDTGVLTVPNAMRRTLWENPPVRNVIGRWALADTRLGAASIRAGDMLVLGLAAANTDPALSRHTGRDLFSFSNDSHAAWGAGPHRCPAQGLAEVITSTAVERLLKACPSVQLTDRHQPLSRGRSIIVGGLTSLPVKFQPTEAHATSADQASGDTQWTSSTPYSPSTHSRRTFTVRAADSAPPARSSRWRFLKGWLRGR